VLGAALAAPTPLDVFAAEQRIQAELADGKELVGREEPIPHLFRVYEQVVSGWPGSTIGLWVPTAKSEHAQLLLATAGYRLGDAA
jgi:hypothetical protein